MFNLKFLIDFFLLFNSMLVSKNVFFVTESIFEDYRTILDCFNYSTNCRNSVTDIGTEYNQFAVIDKLTGKTIWQSPTFAYGYPHIFIQDSNGHITAVNRGTVYK